jgi:hypothetical protein
MSRNPNTSHAVMAQRFEPNTSLDDFPTPPWATRALIEHVIGSSNVVSKTCLEPACGRGFMAKTLESYFASVSASDIHDYGYAETKNFFELPATSNFDWVITNPPFRLAEGFFLHAYDIANAGVALLVRTVFIEGVGRLNRMFSKYPPTVVAQFSERVPMVKGRVDPKASTATGYAWVVWQKPLVERTELKWIPQCRRTLEQASDYTLP